MKTGKRLLAILLTWVMILSTLPVSAAGESAPSAKGAGIPGLKEIKISASPRRPDRSYHLGDMGTASAVWEEGATARDIVWSVETPDDTVEIAIGQSSGEFTVMKAQLPPGGEEGIVSCTIKATARIDGTDYTATKELEVYRSRELPLSPYRSLTVRDRKFLAKPKKITYEVGEYLDLTGMVIEFIYGDGKKWTSINGADCDFLCEDWDEIEKRPLELTDKQLVIIPDHLNASKPVYINIIVKEGTERAVELDVGSNGTASVSPPSAKPGSDIKITAVPNEGYVLDKITWKPEDGSEKNITESASFTMPAKNAFVKVRFKPAPRTVRFMDGEEELFSQAVEYGQQAAKPASDPTKEGWEFAGWYADPACSQAFDFDQDIRTDTPVYAKFKMRTTMSIRVPDKPLDVEDWMDAYFTVSPDLKPTEKIVLLPSLFTVKAGNQELGSFYDPERAKPELMWSFVASELGTGTHTITVSYAGNDRYAGCSGSFTVQVVEKESLHVVDFSPQTAPVNTAYTVSGRILDESNNPVANKSMKIVNQVGYSVTGETDQEGRFSVVMDRDFPAEHGKTIEIKVVSSANDTYKRLSSSHQIQFVDGYTVTVSCDPEAGGTISITNTSPTTQGKEFFAEGETVSLKITENPGYTFDGLTVNGETVTTARDWFGLGGYTASFPMPGKAAEVKAAFTGGGSGTTTYRVTVTGGRVNGSILGRIFAEGDIVTVTADSVSGQTFKEWSGAEGLSFTSGSASSSTASFKMPARDVTLTATYENGGTTTYPVTLICDPEAGGKISMRTVSPTTGGISHFAAGETVIFVIRPNGSMNYGL
ncbi:MAG: InlB B-repeat-containing protein, partial [Lachnospiraceae bacterium]|nr:InlB B-repeat-containing protein [Lachnospiraceae bacterium]